MKLTEEKLKKIIKEELKAIMTEQENIDAKFEEAKSAMEKEANNILSQIEKAAQKTKMSPDMLKGLLVQFLNEK